MNTTSFFIGSILLGIVCAFLHKNKGYSPIAGFCWGFFIGIIGLAVVLLERNKEEQMSADKGHFTMTQWLLLFLCIGFILILLFLIILNLM